MVSRSRFSGFKAGRRSITKWRRMPSRKILTDAQIREAKQLAAGGGLSSVEIARRTGMSPSSALRIGKGTFRKPRPRPKYVPKRPSAARPARYISGHVAHCDDCGVSVRQPCLACYLRQHACQRVYVVSGEMPVAVDLREGERERYQRIVMARRILTTTPRPTEQQREEARRQIREMLPDEVARAVEGVIYGHGGPAASDGELPAYHDDINAEPRHANYRPWDRTE